MILAHYQLAHTIAPNISPHVRYCVYFRITHARREGKSFSPEAMMDVWLEYEGLSDLRVSIPREMSSSLGGTSRFSPPPSSSSSSAGGGGGRLVIGGDRNSAAEYDGNGRSNTSSNGIGAANAPISSSSASSSPLPHFAMLEGAAGVLREAVEMDQKREYPRALACYQRGIEMLLAVVQLTGVDDAKKTEIKKRVEHYLARAEQIKVAMRSM